MDDFVDERDFKLLETDKHTFSVLKRIIKGECRVLLTDHERLIICHTGNPFPTWVWTPDDATDEEMERAFKLTTESCPLGEGYTYNIKYSLADYFIKRAAEEGQKLSIKTNMFAYDCPEIIEPHVKAEGELHLCTEDDIEAIVEFKNAFHNELDIDKESEEKYRQQAVESVANRSLYFWKDAEGKFVASCHWYPNEGMAAIGLVFTKPEARRKHFAENLVYNVTRIAEEAGYLPMLYTDADYIASNSCYERIGYIKRGELCTVGID